MRNLFFLIALLLISTTSGFAQRGGKKTDKNKGKDESKTEKPYAGDAMKGIDLKSMKELNILEGKAALKKGEKAYISYKMHASVGIDGEVSVKDSDVLTITEKKVDYKNKHVDADMKAGADEARVYVFFEAKKAGETVVTLRDWFRGQVQNEYKVTVKVE